MCHVLMGLYKSNQIPAQRQRPAAVLSANRFHTGFNDFLAKFFFASSYVDQCLCHGNDICSIILIGDIWFIGRFGTTILAAMALVFPLLMLMQMLSGGGRETLSNYARLRLTEQFKIEEALRRNVDNLSSGGDEEFGLLCKPRRAWPEARPDYVGTLGKGYGHYLRLPPCRSRFKPR